MFTCSSRTREFRPSLEISNSFMSFFYPITLVINLYFITKIKDLQQKLEFQQRIKIENQNHNFETNGLSNKNLFEYSQTPSKKPPKDNFTIKFNPSRYRIITTQRIKTRIQKLKKQSHHLRNPPRDKETKKSSQRDLSLFNT